MRPAMPTLARSAAGLTLALGIGLAGCAPADRLTTLRAAGLEVIPGPASWSRLTSDDGYSFELPGLPLAEREEWVFHGVRIERTFVDLDVERGLGAYLAYAYLAPGLDERGRERLRMAGQDRITRAGAVVGVPHEVVMLGHRVVEVVVEGVGRWDDYHVVVRSFVAGELVFVLAVIRPAVGTIPAETDRFFGSFRIDRPLPATALAPEPPSSYPDEHPED